MLGVVFVYGFKFLDSSMWSFEKGITKTPNLTEHVTELGIRIILYLKCENNTCNLKS